MSKIHYTIHLASKCPKSFKKKLEETINDQIRYE